MEKQNKVYEEHIYIICLNPHCLKDKQRCLTTKNMHSHPSECSPFYYPADAITKTHWSELEKYPCDNLGIAAKRKFTQSGEKSYLTKGIQALREKIEVSLKELEEKVLMLYPEKEFARCFSSVYGLDKVAESLNLRRNPTYISQLISTNFSAQNYHVLLRLNENYDDFRNTIEGLSAKISAPFDAVLNKHKSYQTVISTRKAPPRKINYGVYKSKFIASSKIEFQAAVVNFPKIANIASFLPWIYTDRHFSDGTHEFKISSLKYPIIQNTGFTVLEEHDIDTYPYTYFKSLFNKQGKGFKLTNGEDIDQFIAQTTVVILRLELGASPRAIIHDSEMKCQYECELKEKTTYRMGVYGCGWSMEVIELN